MSLNEHGEEAEAVFAASRRTLVESFANIRDRHDCGVTFLDAKGRPKFKSYADLYDTASRFARGLYDRGLSPGDTLLLALPEPEEALVAIMGSMLAGCPPAPIYPPMGFLGVPAFLRYLEHVARRAGA